MQNPEQPSTEEVVVKAQAASSDGVQQPIVMTAPFTASETRPSEQTWQSRQWQHLHERSVILQIIGVLLVFVAGFINNCIFGWNINVFNGDNLSTILRLGILLVAFVGVILFRSWWAFLIVPVSWLAGAGLASLLIPLIQGAWPAVKSGVESLPIGLLPSVLIVIIIILVGTLLGFNFKRK